ncbi:MAG: ABC transporter substrate-binding protein [Eubacteriales bacterium]|nr:ABC transporter substrate-binding protein [Eubacteriales bacterium]
MKRKAAAIVISMAMMAGLSASVFAADGEKHLTAGATTGFFGAESLDPGYNWDSWIMSIYGISENLFRLNNNFEAEPWLCESYENTDELTWVLQLRDDVLFSNGNKMTAESVKKCFERTGAENARMAETVFIESMEADGQTLTIKTSKPEPTLINDLCDPLMAVYDSESEIDPELGASCTGPFVATSFEAMAEVQMKKNENYWGGEPKLDTVDLKIVDDQDALNMALQNGEIDLIAQLPAAGTTLFKDDENFVMDSVTSTRTNFLMYNLNTPALQDVNVRNAISMSIDREGYADVVFNGYAEASYGVFASALPYGGTDGFELAVSEFDPEGAAALLAEAGYEDTDSDGILDKDGEKLSLNFVTYSYNTQLLQFADMLQAQLSEIGVDLQIQTYDVLDETMESGAFDIAALSYAMAPTGNEGYFPNMVFVPGASNNYNGYDNAKVTEDVEKLSTTYDKEERIALMRDMEQEILNDGAYAFFVNQQLICVYNKKVTGFEINPTEYYLITNTIDVAE